MTPARLLRIARQRFAAVARRGAIERDIERELASHLDELIREKTAAGLSVREATLEAHREFGAVALIAERSREARGVTAVDGFFDDARYGLRLLRRTPGFTTVAALALAIGIGATAASVAAIAFVLARPLPFTDGDRLISVRTVADDAVTFPRAVSIHQYQAWQLRSRALASIGASRGASSVIADQAAGTFRAQTQTFTPSLFQLLGVMPEAGRLFAPVDDPYDPRARVAIISHRLWQQRFQGAADILGRKIRVNGAERNIIGVLPAGFRFQSDGVDLWLPLIFGAEGRHSAGQDVPQLQVTARLRDGVSLAGARDDLEAIAAALHPDRARPDLEIAALRDTLYGWTRPRLMTMGAMAALLLGLACANVAALLLARGRLRQRELALRAALGAPRRRLVRQLLTESLVLGAAAAIPGAGVTALGLRVVSAALGPPPGLPRVTPDSFDGWVLAMVVLLCALSAIAFGVLPAAAASGVTPGDALSGPAERARRSATGASWRALVGVQVVLAEVLLIAAVLLTISHARITGREVNFESPGLVSFNYTLRATDVIQPAGQENGRPAFDIAPGGIAIMQRLLARLNDVPGAGPAAGMSMPPVNSLILPIVRVRVLDAGGAPAESSMETAYTLVTPGLFATLRTPILRGREFDERDDSESPWTIVINDAMARSLWGDENPIGRRVRLDLGDGERPREVIGVVASIPTRTDRPGVQPVVYTSYAQQPRRYAGPAVGIFAGMTVVIRPSGDVTAVLAAARRAAAELTPDRPIDEIGIVQSHLRARSDERRNYVLSLDTLALLSILLAMIGQHAVTTHDVVGRANEIAVRRALGASASEILAPILKPTFVVVAAGVACGAAAALAVTPLLAPQLWDIAATDAATFGSVSAALLLASAAGCIGAVRRALGLDMAARLRCE